MEACNKAVEVKRIDEVLETLKYLKDDVIGISNRIHHACERVGVQFDPEEVTQEAPPSYGSINQLRDAISEIGGIVSKCSSHLIELERFV
jgi:hypothetical protein